MHADWGYTDANGKSNPYVLYPCVDEEKSIGKPHPSDNRLKKKKEMKYKFRSRSFDNQARWHFEMF